MAIDGINGGNVENWRAKPLNEILGNIEVVEQEDSEVAVWAQAMSAVANAPDNVTYAMTGGSTEEFTAQLEEIEQNGGVQSNGEVPPEEAPPEDVDGVEGTEEVPEEDEEGKVGDEDEATADDATEAEAATASASPEDVDAAPEDTEDDTEGGDEINPDEGINTDDEAIRKRKIKKGETPEE